MRIYSIYLISLLVAGAVACKKKDEVSPAPATPVNTGTVPPQPLVMSNKTTVTDTDGNVYKVGHKQVSSVNQDCFVEKRDKNGKLVWRVVHSATATDERAELISLDEQQHPWVIFSVDGGSNDPAYFTKKEVEAGAFTGVFLNGFGRASGAPRVSVLAHLNPATGKIIKGTFLVARTEEGDHNAKGKTNSLKVSRLGVANGQVHLEASCWFKPPALNATQGNYRFHPDATDANKTGGSWQLHLTLPADLAKLSRSTIVK